MTQFTSLSLAMAAAFAVSFSASAQQNLNNTDIDDTTTERITVTGSRIKGVDLEGAQPLVVLSAEDIKNSGASSLYELLQDLGQLRGGSGTFSTSESGATSTSTPAGQAAASLRGLGPASTLTLINGRRVAASSFAAGTQNFVDINSIPLAAIERVEILATGASAIYGADAVAGVINYILKKDYDKAEVNVSYGNSTASSDEGTANLNIIWGQALAGGNLTLFADIFDRQDFRSTDRAFTRAPILQSNYSYLPKGTPNIYYLSTLSGDEIATPGCATPLVTTEFGERICAYYPNEDDVLRSPFQSAAAGLMFNKDLSSTLNWQTDVIYTRTKSTAVSSPAPINQLNDAEGAWAPESSLDIFPGTTRDNSFITFGDDDIYLDPFLSPTGRRLFGFQFDARFNTPRTIDITTEAVRLVSGLSGTYREWDWESALLLSRSKSTQEAVAGIYNRYKYHAAIAGELCSDSSIASRTGNTLSCNTGANLVGLYNPFLQNDAVNEARLALAQEVPTRDGLSTLYGWDARISGELFSFNEQMVRAAFGAELRREKITDEPSLNAQARFENNYLVDVFGFGSSLSSASRNQAAVFTEVYVPLTQQLELLAAGRYDHYNDFGGTFNPKIGFTYRPTDELVVRASWASSFRAPSLTQSGVKLRTTTARYDCSANELVNQFYCGGLGGTSSVNVLELGNPELDAETSESVSVGFGYSPTSNTTLTVDYWQFDHKKLVDTDLTAAMARSIRDVTQRHCGLVPEGQTGISLNPNLAVGRDRFNICQVLDSQGRNLTNADANMTQILNNWVSSTPARITSLPLQRDHVILLDNVGRQQVKGIDTRLSHTFELPQGKLGVDIDWTHYLSFERNKAGSDEIESLVGTYRYPRNIANLRVSWRADNFSTGLAANYTASYADDISRLRTRDLAEMAALGVLDENGERDVASWTTLRGYLGYEFTRASVTFSIDNLLDRDPPKVFGTTRGFDSINHDALGRNYRLSFSYFF
ncbi:TonB-dependent receptor domain-containing protein [Alishewanella tabrizica]|uniref:TonB-dependent receptor n=1 Tax=Alishewanella tabrizica TaxID=671278 RepID=A0ABQ2WFP2_9ALTE|nr:TonB-dependent receptor [Alishewanella tabrizica]GGW54060.1 TonB-dependent receptor [Alishewanella tabrizica]